MTTSPRRAAVVRGSDWDTTPAVQRAVDFLKGRGYEVTVLCWGLSGRPQPHHPAPDVPVRCMQIPVGGAGPAYFLAWLIWWTWLAAQLLVGRYDVVHAMNVDCLVPAVLTKSAAQHSVLYDVRDPWGMTLSNRRAPIPQLFTALERWACMHADGLLLSQGDLSACATYFGLRVCSHVPVSQVLNVPLRDSGAQRHGVRGRPLLINYSGRLSGYRGAYVLADAVEGRNDVAVHVYGKVTGDAIARRYAELANARVEGLVSHETALRYLGECDVVSLLYDPGMQIMRVASANKMFEAMMLGRPYVCSEGTYPALLAHSYELGWAVPYGDPEALSDLIDRLVADPDAVEEAGRRGRAAYEAFFSWQAQLRNLHDLYQAVEGHRPAECHYKGWHRFLGQPSEDRCS